MKLSKEKATAPVSSVGADEGQPIYILKLMTL